MEKELRKVVVSADYYNADEYKYNETEAIGYFHKWVVAKDFVYGVIEFNDGRCRVVDMGKFKFITE